MLRRSFTRLSRNPTVFAAQARMLVVPTRALLLQANSALFPRHNQQPITAPFPLTPRRSYSSIPTEADVDQVSSDDFHHVADEVLETILTTYEDLAESIPDLDVELAQGVLTLYLPTVGSYVINKQPPNKQIWWSSPISGPKRFDLVHGVWTSLRDGTTLKDDLETETNAVTASRDLPHVEFEI